MKTSAQLIWRRSTWLCGQPSRRVASSAGSEAAVADVYQQGGALMGKIMNALKEKGISTSPLRAEDLAAIDQFHIGGVPATEHLVSQLSIPSGCRILDIGCGIGGFSRYLAKKNPDCTVHGVDLTPDYIQVCNELKSLTQIKNTTYEVGSAASLSGPDGHYDVVCMLHVGMNIEDKSQLFQQVHRVLRPGGAFAVYDVMKLTETAASSLIYPVPWANSSSQSYVTGPDEYIAAAERSGFEVLSRVSRKDFAISFFVPIEKLLRKINKMPTYSLALLFGEDTAEVKMKNLIHMLRCDIVEPVEMLFRKL